MGSMFCINNVPLTGTPLYFPLDLKNSCNIRYLFQWFVNIRSEISIKVVPMVVIECIMSYDMIHWWDVVIFIVNYSTNVWTWYEKLLNITTSITHKAFTTNGNCSNTIIINLLGFVEWWWINAYTFLEPSKHHWYAF